MSYFDSASLVMIPSGYKTSKVYSVKPTDGSGDLTFSRSNDTATRVNSAGLIEKVRTNQVLQSETLNNAYWGKINVSITANAIANPLDGALTADLLTVTDPSGPVEKTIVSDQTQAFTAGTPYTISAYYKAGSVSSVFRILAYDGTALYTGGTIDLATIGNSTAPYVSVGNGWYRFSFTFTPANSTSVGFIYLVNYPFGVAANAGTNVYVYGAQIEEGDIATDYIATTSAAVSVGPVANVPRLDYLGSSCGKLLLEPQRTNLVTYSEQLDNAVWNKDPATTTINANSAVSPDGYTNADLFGSSSPSAQAGVYQTILGLTPAATYYISAYVKLGTATNVCITVNNTVAWNTVGGQSFSAADGLNTNTWTRVGFSFTAPAGANINYHIGQHQQSGVDPQSLGTFLVWGAQVEAGAYATSYIPTLGAAVTRGADACSKTGISSLIGQTEGTLFIEFYDTISPAAANDTRFQISDYSFNNWIFLGYPDGGAKQLRAYINGGGVATTFYSSVNVVSGLNKAALGYKSGDFVLYLNGALVGSSSVVRSIPATSRVDLNSDIPADPAKATSNVSQALLFKTRLSNASLAELTSL